MDLHLIRRGHGEPLLLLHGFTTGARAWDDQASALARRFTVITPDLVGHGRSPLPDDPSYDMSHCIADIVSVLDRLEVERTHCLGYSMGGRIALALALAHPGRIRSLILESASPGIADLAERRQRQARDEALAARIESDGVAAFVEAWMAQPLFASQHALPRQTLAAARALRLENSARGLAISLRGLGIGNQPSYWAELPTLKAPTLLIAGERDEKFRDIAARMATAIPSSRIAILAGAGHTTHLEQPEEFLRTVTAFLYEIQPSSPQRRRGAENPSQKITA
jgi:2-succinyl-6-hydroxy-2,4-cyclohexadiene-1-carboxylate synthase